MANKRLTVLTVCGAGVGSSLMVKMNAEDILSKLGIKAKIINSDVTSAKGNTADILVTTMDIYKLIKDINVKQVVILDNPVSAKELEEKLIPAYEKALC
ncbi:PTS sugar transporter subunit IIB [Sporanaerobacter sp. PP17-6a]|jgi:PTS system ascorbate-specific IIB component|uniref:PTS sugar transporter subunit IIB n=1 Tax=Sporanaerobacter sp. PP17-6a TaxID=1891289 RepID=UPI00089FDF87|nr:PTS sugar transporter subunit IIB [Sporanaerobacter sp. PP17-6a]MBE6083381.1 PTS sugar transporter subunit IIB [Tissierellaceae bacterium]SCL88295.1 Ascorbate-specific phosphotransferase enzyme IIB component [Sporanaerobacter sp. PP17-6a]